MSDDLDPVELGVVERLAAIDALAGSASHYAVKRRWYQRMFDSRTAIVVLISVAAGLLAYSVIVNQQAIERSATQARQAKAQATAAAQGQLAAVQLICTMERDIRMNSPHLTEPQRHVLIEYDGELQCGAALKKPHQPLVLPPTPKSKGRSAPGGGQGGVQTPPSHPRPHPAPSPTPVSSSPAPQPSRTPTPTASPTPAPTCLLRNPLTGKCVVPNSTGAGPRLPPAVLPSTPGYVILLGLGCIEWRAGEAKPAIRPPEVCVHLPLAHVLAVHRVYVPTGLAVRHAYSLG